MNIISKIRAHINGGRYDIIWWFVNSLLSSIPSKNIRFWGLKIVGMNLAKNVKFYSGFHIRNPKGIII